MKIINKLVLVILLIILMFISLLFTIYSFGLTGEGFLSLVEQDLYQNYILGIIFLFVTIISALAIYPLLKRESEPAILQTGKNGDINISLKAIDKIVRTVTLEQEGIDIKNIKLDTRQNRLYIELMITVKDNLSIPEVSSDLKNSIKDRLNETVGTDLAEIKILIDNVDPLSKKNKIKKEKSDAKKDSDLERNKEELEEEKGKNEQSKKEQNKEEQSKEEQSKEEQSKEEQVNENEEEKVDAKEFLNDFKSKE